MMESSFTFPSIDLLSSNLTRVLIEKGVSSGPLTILDRKPNVFTSTFPNEIVTCRFRDGHTIHLFCKYGTIRKDDTYGHKGDVTYESDVYNQVLEPINISLPPYHGTYKDRQNESTWLILGFLERSTRVNKGPVPSAMLESARWIGKFHTLNEVRLSREPIPVLKRYNHEYYVSWARRTSLFAGKLHKEFPWLSTLCKAFEELAVHLIDNVSPTVIHGEYYPRNILYREGQVYPVDWQSAAIAPGEIDLATLTDGRWSIDIVQECEREYINYRWPEGSDEQFERTLSVARAYVNLRWLGDRPEWTTHEDYLWRYDKLHSLGKNMGLI